MKRTEPSHSRDKNRPTTQAGESFWANFKQIAIAVVLALIIKTSIVEAYKIPTSSMEDTLLVGDFLLANKFIYGAQIPLTNWRLPSFHEPRRGEVVIFIFPGDGVTKYIKRCVGTPGDTIVVRDKALFVNGERFPDPEHSKFIDTTLDGRQVIQPNRDNFGPYIVPRDHYFMMGDNRDNSYDSRYWQSVDKNLILGEAMVIHWSWDEDARKSPDVNLTDPLSVPRLFLFNTMHFFEKVRWNRMFRPIS
jgi:signal peptidase I